MSSRIRSHLSTILVAMVTAAVTASAPAIAHGVHAAFSHNSDKVDGIHAAKANAGNKKSKLIATDNTGKFPVSVIPKADANTLDGQDSSAFLPATGKAADADLFDGENSDAFARGSELPTAGTGLSNNGGAFDVNPALVQSRVTTACAAGQFLRSINQDGTAVCGADTDADTGVNAVSPSGGLTGSIVNRTLNLGVNSAVLQSRVSGSCGPGQSIRAIGTDGSVTCELDDAGTGDITGVTASTGLTGGGTSGDVSLSVGPNAIGMRELAPTAGGTGFGFISGILTAAADQFVYNASAPAFTPTVSGTCLVTAQTQISSGVNNGQGPFFRIAVKRNGVDGNDGSYGFYFPPMPAGLRSAPITRTRLINVTAGEAVQFGLYVGSPPAEWQGDSIDGHVDYLCF